MPLQTSTLYIYTPNTSQSVAKVLLGKTDENKKNFFGSLFGIFEIDLNDKNLFSVLEEISDEVEDTYYNFNNIHPRQFHLEDHFEETVKSLNAKVHNILVRNQLEKEAQKFHLLFGVVKQNKLIFTATPGIYAFLIFKTKTASYRVADIIGNAKRSDGREISEPYAYKMFADILSGELHFHDYLYFCNKNLFFHIPLDDVKYLVIHSSLQDSTEEMRGRLWQASINTTFAGILLYNQPGIDTSQSRSRGSATQRSLSHLLRTEHSTERLLTVSLTPTLERFNQKIFALIQEATQRLRHLVSSLSSIGLVGIKKTAGRVSSFIRINLKSSFTAVYHVKERLQRRCQRKSLVTQIVPRSIFAKCRRHIQHGAISYWNTLKHIFNHLWGKFTKRFTWWQILGSIIILLFIIGFIINLKDTRRIRKAEKEEATYQTQITEIQTALNNIQALLIYKDTERAKTEIHDVLGKIPTLPQGTEDRQKKAIDLENQAKSFLNTIRKAIIIEEAQIVHDRDTIQSTPQWIARIEQHLFMWSIAGNEPIVKISFQDQKEIPTTLSLKAPQESERIAYAVDEKNTEGIILLADQSLARFNAKGIVNAPDITWNPQEEDIIDLSLYNKRLYALSAKNQQVFKHLPSSTGFGSSKPWILKAPKHESPFVSLTIDGAVYLVTEKGEVYKFTSGTQQSFEIEIIDPPIQTASKIFTDPSSKFLYVLEPVQKRLILYEKASGKLKRQYLFPALTQIQDFALDEKEETLFLLEKNILYRIRLLPDT